MPKKYFLWISFLLGALVAFEPTITSAQGDQPAFRVTVNMVQLNVAVTDNKGNYVTGLRPEDFVIAEDGIAEKIATFGEGDSPVRRVGELAASGEDPADPPRDQPKDQPKEPRDLPASGRVGSLSSALAGSNVFVLFDTSNYMYRGFVFAQDAIADFVRSLDTVNRISFYSYSRDLSRSANLTSDRTAVLRAVRTTVAGDDAALYNSLLLTLKDASQYTGRKVVVVFSNGPDNVSVVPPEDVAELAQSAGIVIYMVSTQQTQLDPVSTAVFERMTAATGGKAYFAKNWHEQKQAFSSIRDDLGHLYSLSYYPRPNANRGWRSISVKLVAGKDRKYRIRTRNGYRPVPLHSTDDNSAAEKQ
ncbi:MAG: VWA domain-containing protein [Acidobacteria bacterium]|nr:VWA domain-containing protein [Acidobacteriota bacterium]